MIKGLPRPARKDELVSLDLEMFGQEEERLHRPHGEFACLSVAYGPKEVYQVYDLTDLRRSLNNIENGRWVIHHALYDILQLRGLVGTVKQRPLWDTMTIEQGLYGGWYGSFGLDDLYRRYFAEPLPKEVVKEFSKRQEMTPAMKRYAAKDAVAAVQIAKRQQADIAEEDLSMKHYDMIDEPLIWAILDMPPACIDVDGWLKLAKYHARRGMKIETELGFNVFSHEIVKAAIDKKVGHEIKDTNGKDTLEPLERVLRFNGRTMEAEFVAQILLARQFRKAAETYGEKWIEQHVEPGGLVYPDWHGIGTETARMACSNPNLQNIPTRDLPVFRTLFISRHGAKGRLLKADQEQQEPRILAYLADDSNMRHDILSGVDLHKQTQGDFVLRDRRAGKDTNLGLLYGMSAYGLARRTGITEEQARIGINKRNKRYPSVYEWTQKTITSAMSLDYVKTTMGRRVWINRYALYGGAERNAINDPVQGSAAEQTKLWKVMLHAWASDNDIPYQVCLVVHDEIVVDTLTEMVPLWRRQLKFAGEESGRVVVPGFPMQTKVTAGKNWGDGE